MTDRAVDKEANRALGKKFFAAQDDLRGGPAPELCSPAYTAQLGSNPPMNLAQHQAFAQAFYAGLPDVHHEVERVIVEDDTVVVRFVLHGTHSEPLFGMPPSQHKVTIPAHVILRVRDGKVTQITGLFDEAGMLRQIGVLPG